MWGLLFNTEPVPEEVNKVISASGKKRFSSLIIGVVNTKSPIALKRIIRIFFGFNNLLFEKYEVFMVFALYPLRTFSAKIQQNSNLKNECKQHRY